MINNDKEEKTKERLLELYNKSEKEGLNLLDFQEGVKLWQTLTKKEIKR